MDEILVQKLREAIRKKRETPPKERFAEMVRRGAIDEEGRVLVKMPQPPNSPRKTPTKNKPVDPS